MKRTIVCLLIIASVAVAGCKNGSKTEADQTEEPMENVTPVNTAKWANLGEEPLLEMKTTCGTMTIKLYSDTKLHRDNFIKLCSRNYYNGICFHRVIKGFMIQAGDPYTKDTTKVAQYGTGGPGYTIPAEIIPEHNHKKGALASARLGDRANPERASSGSQFYIVEDPQTCAQLDGQYTVFGEVVNGFEVIDKIASKPTGPRDCPVERIDIISIEPVIEEAAE